jgi:hypothetical protein
MLLNRELKKRIIDKLFKNKVIILYGARQVGKTTLVKEILKDFASDGRYLNCEMLSVQEGLKDAEGEKIKSFLGDYKLVVLDEAQNIPNIGKILKIAVDTFPELQIIATGSSSFDLANKSAEPLTGRNFTFTLYPFSVGEIKQLGDWFYVNSKLESIMRFGLYPEVFSLPEKEAAERLEELSANYLYKDILQFEGIKKSTIIKNLLQALALQVGQEVSYQELASTLGINRLTVQKYIDILEQTFIIFKLPALSRNKRKEIAKSIKVYFYDLGIRNSLIQNCNPLNIRNDIGALWENFCMVERLKLNSLKGIFTNRYFWRTYDQKEIDYIEESGGGYAGFEFKWSSGNARIPKDFLSDYSNSTFNVVTKDNFHKFILS